MKKVQKYIIPEEISISDRKWPDCGLDRSPIWCSVDLRDGNQALPDPLTPDQKLEYFEMLCEMGFKHIEVGFPSASQDEFDFFRRLIDEDRIPEDVFIMGLTQMRPHLIKRTLEAFEGCKQGIVHAYIAPSDLHMKQVFEMSRDQLIDLAVSSTEQISDLVNNMTLSLIHI